MQYLVLFAMFIAGALRGIAFAMHSKNRISIKFPRYSFWGDASWSRKYDKTLQKERFFLSSTILAFLTNGKDLLVAVSYVLLFGSSFIAGYFSDYLLAVTGVLLYIVAFVAALKITRIK